MIHYILVGYLPVSGCGLGTPLLLYHSWLNELTQHFTLLHECYVQIGEQYRKLTGETAPENVAAKELVRQCMTELKAQERAEADRQDVLRFVSLTSPEEKFATALGLV